MQTSSIITGGLLMLGIVYAQTTSEMTVTQPGATVTEEMTTTANETTPMTSPTTAGNMTGTETVSPTTGGETMNTTTTAPFNPPNNFSTPGEVTSQIIPAGENGAANGMFNLDVLLAGIGGVAYCLL